MGPHGNDEREAFLRKLALDALEGLELNWGEAYRLAFGEGRWTAERRDGLGGALEAGSADELHALIVADYNVKPVKRP